MDVVAGAAKTGGVAGAGALGAVTAGWSAPAAVRGIRSPSVGPVCEARTSATRNADVSPSVALMAAPVTRMRADLAG